MTIIDCISDILSSLDGLFEIDQEIVIKKILLAEKVFFLDTCFVTKLHNLQTENVLKAFEEIEVKKEEQTVVFVVTELVLYELKDSQTNELQAKNKAFFEKMSENGFCLLVLKEECVYENIKPFLNHSYKKWNEIFSRVIHENIANLSFNGLVMKDSRMPYFGFSEVGYNIPDDRDFIGNILRYLKNAKKSKDSMAEEIICTSLFQIFELTHGSKRNEYIFCSHDLSAIARINKAIQTSYSNMQEQFKSINVFSFIQFMVEKGLISSKEEVVEILRKIMGENVRLIIGQDIPFTPVEKMMTIEEATERIFKGEHIEYVGRRT